MNYLEDDRNSLEEIAEWRKECPVYGFISPEFIAWMNASKRIPAKFRDEIDKLVVNAKTYSNSAENKTIYRAINHFYDEGNVEVDMGALVSRAEGETGAYVMAWVWVDNPDPDEAEAGDLLGYCDVCEKPVLSGAEHDTENGCGDLVHEGDCFDAHNQNCSLCPIGG